MQRPKYTPKINQFKVRYDVLTLLKLQTVFSVSLESFTIFKDILNIFFYLWIKIRYEGKVFKISLKIKDTL